MKTLLDKVPGTAWSGLLITAAALIQANFENAMWYQMAMFAIFGALKGYGVNFSPILKKIEEAAGEEFPAEQVTMSRGVAGQTPPPPAESKVARWFLG